MTIYAVTYAYSDDVALRDAERPAHREYLAGLADQGALVISGPWGEGEAPGALLLFRAESADEVAALVAQDPFVVKDVVVEQTVRAWVPVLGPARSAFEG